VEEAASRARQRIQDLVSAKTVTVGGPEGGEPLARFLMSPPISAWCRISEQQTGGVTASVKKATTDNLTHPLKGGASERKRVSENLEESPFLLARPSGPKSCDVLRV